MGSIFRRFGWKEPQPLINDEWERGELPYPNYWNDVIAAARRHFLETNDVKAYQTAVHQKFAHELRWLQRVRLPSHQEIESLVNDVINEIRETRLAVLRQFGPIETIDRDLSDVGWAIFHQVSSLHADASSITALRHRTRVIIDELRRLHDQTEPGIIAQTVEQRPEASARELIDLSEGTAEEL